MFKIGEEYFKQIPDVLLNYLTIYVLSVPLTGVFDYHFDFYVKQFVKHFDEKQNEFAIIHFNELQKLLDDPEFHIRYNQNIVYAIPPEIPQ